MNAAVAFHRRPVAPAPSARPQDNRRALWSILLRSLPEAGARRARQDAKQFAISNDTAHAIVREGIAAEVLVPLGELLEIGATQLAPVIGVDRTTMRRYAQNDQTLPRHSAETVLRLAELEAMALGVFASESAAHAWLKKEHPLLGESPIDAASTSYGAQRVREILIAIRHGGVV
ncbi:MAG TPA: antitoxin Xre/MbcA/ParS toxin-binding domain-containing protein [Ramlibacter sp.]|uniref:antitoxin Xre/MbcA/ParS toxin-binding domain-containing protein n=1 Tax=Ramlibacter sp. TaxID=1917967 RepID=UPI002D150FF4|nr:antitoxin Xre/MbcA/ParS toxin-binding domain-containing protein [Ramlibacter sp.]HVZ45860.1 antitoxin Xre/MbcA/ParS toxin-binding domain-containing protein [Ramlibacter sp.]